MAVNTGDPTRGDRSSGRVTLKDIATEAGVSLMTVSNVVNGNHARVSAATVERIGEILQRRGYVVNASARSLSARSSRLVGLLVPNAEDDVLVLSPHSVEVFGHLEKAVRDRGRHLLFRGVGAPTEVDAIMRSWNLDGAVVLGFRDDEVDRLGAVDKPVVALDSYSANSRTLGVRADDHEGGRLAGEHLLSLGHRRIAFAGPPATGAGVIDQRHAGFLAAHEAAGVRWDPADRVVVNPTWELGVETGRALASEHPEVTAVFATADILAAGLVEGIVSAGRSVPGDVSVVGFDDIEMAHQVTPKLTTVRQDVERKGAVAAGILLDEIESGSTPSQAVVVPVELVQRDSAAARG